MCFIKIKFFICSLSLPNNINTVLKEIKISTKRYKHYREDLQLKNLILIKQIKKAIFIFYFCLI